MVFLCRAKIALQMKVLIADDSNFILERLSEMLSNIGRVEIVGSYTNGTDTLKALKVLKPDLAIIDIKMPGLTGLQVLSEIRKVDKRIKIIILTFFKSGFYHNMAMEEGADYFFSKVDDFEKIAPLVDEMVTKDENNFKK
jgi:DNA-binding NarL/FixJ family response regulator